MLPPEQAKPRFRPSNVLCARNHPAHTVTCTQPERRACNYAILLLKHCCVRHRECIGSNWSSWSRPASLSALRSALIVGEQHNRSTAVDVVDVDTPVNCAVPYITWRARVSITIPQHIVVEAGRARLLASSNHRFRENTYLCRTIGTILPRNICVFVRRHI